MNHMAPVVIMAEIAYRQQRIRDDYKRANSGRRYRSTRASRTGERQ